VSSLAFQGEIPRQRPSAPPALGAHTDEVLQANLNYSTEQLAELRAQGVLGASPSTH
jgi:crotonobetainyl-CoA:carnitine CoA-transferase CaiB-like acyl-CoA transferase